MLAYLLELWTVAPQIAQYLRAYAATVINDWRELLAPLGSVGDASLLDLPEGEDDPGPWDVRLLDVDAEEAA